MTPRLRVVGPSNQNRTVPVRRPNAELRTREYLTPAEIDKLLAVAKRGRYGQRDATLVLQSVRAVSGWSSTRRGLTRLGTVHCTSG
jgi:hypothetical protein